MSVCSVRTVTIRLWSDLVALCSSVQQTLLDGELKQVVILVPQWLTAAWTEGGVVRWGLKHRGVHLTVEGRKRHTWEKECHYFILTIATSLGIAGLLMVLTLF